MLTPLRPRTRRPHCAPSQADLRDVGQVTNLANLKMFPKEVLGMWGAGTGAAGLLGPGLYLLMTRFEWPAQSGAAPLAARWPRRPARTGEPSRHVCTASVLHVHPRGLLP